MIQDQRIHMRTPYITRSGQYVLYWMQQSQRAEGNHALEYAIRYANQHSLPVLVLFVLTESFPEANRRHYIFMLEGLQEVERALAQRGIQLVVVQGDLVQEVVRYARDASLLVCDRGYLRIQKAWRAGVISQVKCMVTEVESDVVVPVELVSQKEEYSAGTIRNKILSHRPVFLKALQKNRVKQDSFGLRFQSLTLTDIDQIVASLAIDQTVLESKFFHGGLSHARKRLQSFINNKLNKYEELSNDPSLHYCSDLSPYLHFGQISPVEVALAVMHAKGASHGAQEAFLEELIVRRELSMNFVHYNKDYDSFTCLPHWAQISLQQHGNDKREYLYSKKDFEQAKTHDPYWNAAQMEMVLTGKMQGYMRMYWGKKIIEWSKTPQQAYKIMLWLNNKYELDGRDPNGFTGVAWCFGKHDRAWKERPVFGKIRYMNSAGLLRKFNMDGYLNRINKMKMELMGYGKD